MFSLRRSPLKVAKQNAAQPGHPVSLKTNPFDSDDELNSKKPVNSSRKVASEPVSTAQKWSTNPFDDDNDERKELYSYSVSSAARSKYKNDFRDCGGVENQPVQELENYAVYKAEETTKAVNDCLKVALDIREDATKTLVTLHHQGEQITRTHAAAADIDLDLSRGEKLLGSLGGIFSKTWKPKKTRPIKGPVITRDDSFVRRSDHLEQKVRLGLTSGARGQSRARTPPPEPTTALQKVEVEKTKQDDVLSEISNALGELKDIAVDMGSEIDRQNKTIDHFYDDVDELNFRMKGANLRGRRLLGK